MIKDRKSFEDSYRILEYLRSQESSIRQEQREFIQKFKPDGVKELSLGSWECPESPFGCCAYDKENDPSEDECVFCGEPDERK